MPGEGSAGYTWVKYHGLLGHERQRADGGYAISIGHQPVGNLGGHTEGLHSFLCLSVELSKNGSVTRGALHSCSWIVAQHVALTGPIADGCDGVWRSWFLRENASR